MNIIEIKKLLLMRDWQTMSTGQILTAVCSYKVLFKYSMFTLFHIEYVCFHTTVARLSSAMETSWPAKLKIIALWIFIENVC